MLWFYLGPESFVHWSPPHPARLAAWLKEPLKQWRPELV